MTARIRHDNVRACDLLAADHLPTCPACGDLRPHEATVCECGEKLFPGNTTAPVRASLDGPRAQGQKEHSVMAPHDVDCTCNRCYLDQLEGDPFAAAAKNGLRLIHDALDRRNVVDLHDHSKRVPS